MVYRVGEMILQKTQEIFRGKVNSVMVCRDISKGGELYYTVMEVYDRNKAKILMNLFHPAGTEEKTGFVTDFTWKDSYFCVFEYEKERLLERFFQTEINKVSECEQLGMNLITTCLACRMPYPVLYLQLKQGQIHLSKEKSVYLGLGIDLSELSEKITEKECATLCARIIFNYIEGIKPGKTISGKLLEKKLWKGGYQKFIVLYKDLQMAAQPVKKETSRDKFVQLVKKNRDKIFRVFIIICIIAVIVAAFMMVSQWIFSDIPFLRIFTNSFEQIGNQSLLQ